MKHDDTLFLRHILDAIAKVERYLSNVDESMFYENSLLQDGVIRQIEIIGEATKRLSRGLREQYPHLPWQDITGMRDKLIHGYFGVDIGQVWLTAVDDLPVLKREVNAMLNTLESPST
ncbi:MAG TPA: hypothetical protein DCL15_24245 [Chloroflexi bacterium]|nr:hypothetical protein [Chloroflexota bacterium]HHW84684.1 DUF86 domain-containing protein [Chloroflexota bacterium]